ncbi:MAG: rhodanese-like domain-containing protein [Methylophilaceae bacterium]|nr:rhodanese-like domain-containing protein [Methylophilaceae bacterium]
MEFLSDKVIYSSLALSSGLMLLWPLLMRGVGGNTNLPPNAAVLLINRDNAIVLDVRDEAEFASGSITGARNIPLAQLADRIAELQRYKDKAILVNCQTGTRSLKACGILRKHEFSKVFGLDGGLNAWAEAKLPTVRKP